jgi:uncharacterized protein involved in copper resistance
MNKLIVTLIAGAFALGSGALIAQGLPPVKAEDTAKLKAEKEAAKEAQAKMTPEEKAAAKKAKHAKKQKDLAHAQKVGNPNPQAKAEAITKSAEAPKSQPKALPDEKKSSGQ